MGQDLRPAGSRCRRRGRVPCGSLDAHHFPASRQPEQFDTRFEIVVPGSGELPPFAAGFSFSGSDAGSADDDAGHVRAEAREQRLVDRRAARRIRDQRGVVAARDAERL